MISQNLPPKRPLESNPINAYENLVNVIFESFDGNSTAILGWSAERINNAKKQWVLGFAENQINTMAQVQAGMRQLRAKPNGYVPSVGEFISWCRGNEYQTYGLPEPSEILERFNAFLCRDCKPMKYRSNAEYWLLSAIERQSNRNRFWTTEQFEKAAKAELESILAKCKQGVRYGNPETKELRKPRKPKLSPEKQQAFWKGLRKQAETGVKL